MKILIAEDDAETAEFIRKGLDELGHHVIPVDNGVDALNRALSEELDVVILDRMLPGMEGSALVRRMRAEGIEVPALMLTALGRIEDRVDGLEAGADDYLVKPFAFSELAARVNALGRRKLRGSQATRLEHHGLAMDLLKRQVVRDGSAIALQPREFRILEELLKEGGRIVTRTMILERVWNYHFDPQTNLVETHMSRLRSKLNQGGKGDLIETVRGVGYRMGDED